MFAALAAFVLAPGPVPQKLDMRDLEKVVRSLMDVGVAVGSFARTVGERLLQVTSEGVAVRAQEPRTTISQKGRDTLVRLDFGGAQGKGPNDLSGAVSISHTLLTKEARVGFDNFRTGGRQVKGAVGLELFPQGEPANVMIADLDVDAQGIQFTGPAKVKVTSQNIVLNNGARPLLVGPTGSQFPAKLTNVTLDPFKSRSMLPMGGSVYLKDPHVDPDENPLGQGVTITFLPTTPTDRIVQVSVAGNPPLRIEIPGLR